jgi:hypothetical protein
VTEFPTILLGFTGHVLDRNYRGPAKSDTLLASLTISAYHYHFKHLDRRRRLPLEICCEKMSGRVKRPSFSLSSRSGRDSAPICAPAKG